MSLSANSFYTVRHSCSSPIENAYLLSEFRNNSKNVVSNQSSTFDEAAVDQLSPLNFDVEIKSTPPLEKQKYQLKLPSWAKTNEGSEAKSINLERKGNDDLCRICGADEPPVKAKIIECVDCYICDAWGHSIFWNLHSMKRIFVVISKTNNKVLFCFYGKNRLFFRSGSDQKLFDHLQFASQNIE